jgi:hypothetical protein
MRRLFSGHDAASTRQYLRGLPDHQADPAYPRLIGTGRGPPALADPTASPYETQTQSACKTGTRFNSWAGASLNTDAVLIRFLSVMITESPVLSTRLPS